MNRIHRTLWNDQTATCIAVAENTCGAGKQGSSSTASASASAAAAAAGARFGLKILSVSLMMACGTAAWAEPTGGVVSAGSATIGGTSTHMVITQTTANVAINWQSFSIAGDEWVQFVQPDASSVALNRVVGPDPSSILGNLTSNGKVFLVNPNGILFGTSSSVNVGGLVASTLGISDADFMASNYRFSGADAGAVVNRGDINANPGGYVALLGANVSNEGWLVAQQGTVALAAGNAMTLDMAGDKLLSVSVGEGVADALATNSGVIVAQGGSVLMTTQVAGSLLANAVNNTGVIYAQTLQNVAGTIRLLGGMETGSVNVAGSLNADASGSDNGGFVETSAARVAIAPTAMVSTAAVTGESGEWLVGSGSFSIGGTLTDNIAGTTLSALLVTNNVTISTAIGADGAVVRSLSDTRAFAPTSGGDIDVKEALAWKASSTPTTLTLLAGGDVNIDAPISATNGNLAVCCGGDVNVALGADITTTNGSVLLSAGRDVDLQGALTTTNGNVTICAANDILIGGKITLTHTTNIVPEESLGLPLGLVLTAGYGAGAPGADGGTVVFAPLAPPATVTDAPTTITYNPVSYSTPTDYAVKVIGLAPVQRMLVYAQAEDKVADGTTTATLSPLLQGNPVGDVSLVAGAGSTAHFDSAAAGTDKTVTLTGYSLGGDDAGNYALAVACCGPAASRTTADITAGASTPTVEPPVEGTTPLINPARGTASTAALPTPFSWANFTASSDLLTVLPTAPLPASSLVVVAPAALHEAAAALPVAAPRATTRTYRAPVRRPKVERN